MNKVVSNCSQSADTQSDGNPVNGSDWATQVVGLDASLVTHCQDVSRAAGRVGGFTGSDDCFTGQISRFEVCLVSSASGEDARSWRSPGGILGVNSLDCERVLGQKSNHFRPRHFDRGEGIVDFDSSIVVDNLRHNQENPDNHGNSEAVEQGNQRFSGVAGLQEREESQGDDCVSRNKVNPTGFASKNVYVLHDFEITGIIPLKRELSAFSPRKVAA